MHIFLIILFYTVIKVYHAIHKTKRLSSLDMLPLRWNDESCRHTICYSKKKKSYKRSIPQHVAENVLNREFTAEKPNEKWVTDVTELKYGSSKKAYLSAILDLYDGSIVSYVLGHSQS